MFIVVVCVTPTFTFCVILISLMLAFGMIICCVARVFIMSCRFLMVVSLTYRNACGQEKPAEYQD
jgi:hypothetical protein